MRSPRIDRFWDINTILSRETPVDCGPVSVDFINLFTFSTPVSTVFDDDRVNYSFANIYTEDTTLKGPYNINYKVYHTNYVSN